jgi:hypothetical protein
MQCPEFFTQGMCPVHTKLHSSEMLQDFTCAGVWNTMLQVRPPVKHRFGCGPLQPGEESPTVRVFRHRLLQHFMLSLFCKLPVQPMTRIRDMRAAFMVRTWPLCQGLDMQGKGFTAFRLFFVQVRSSETCTTVLRCCTIAEHRIPDLSLLAHAGANHAERVAVPAE